MEWTVLETLLQLQIRLLALAGCYSEVVLAIAWHAANQQ